MLKVQNLWFYKPVVVFEFGLGAADHYGTQSKDIYDYFNGINYQLNTLKGYLQSSQDLTNEEFGKMYDSNKEYYFIAYSKH